MSRTHHHGAVRIPRRRPPKAYPKHHRPDPRDYAEWKCPGKLTYHQLRDARALIAAHGDELLSSVCDLTGTLDNQHHIVTVSYRPWLRPKELIDALTRVVGFRPKEI